MITLRMLRCARPTMLAVSMSLSAICVAQSTLDRTIQLEGHRVNVSESGSGTPEVVFESGLGEDTSTWTDIRPQVAALSRCFFYDRPGIGKSKALPRIRGKLGHGLRLHSILQAANVRPPYVLVGHSLGGAIVLMYAHLYPTEVSGLVLVDPANPRLDDLLHSHMSAADWEARQKALDEAMPKMPTAVQAELKAYQRSGKEVEEVTPLPDVPVVLLTGTKKNPEFPSNPLEQDLKLELHNGLFARIPRAKHVLVPNSRHYIQNDAPEVVVEAVREIVARSSPRL